MTEFIELVQKMRDAQRLYFKTREQPHLLESKRIEGEVDRWLKTLASVESDKKKAPSSAK